MSLINVIMSGGVGSRLWPLSRKSRPKQYIPLFEGKTLFQLCALRNYGICDRILVVGNRLHQRLSRMDLEAIGITEYAEIMETVPRNTAAAIAFAAFNASPQDILLVTPSDQIITKQDVYAHAVEQAVRMAEEGYLVTFGIQPARPETGYGYIEYQGNNVLSFREKPDMQTAAQMLQSGNFLWNSGMFCLKAGVFLEELQKHAPEVFHPAFFAWSSREGDMLTEAASRKIPSISVDYAVMERSDRIKVVPADLGWSDLGSFDALWEHFHAQRQGDDVQEHLILGTEKQVMFLGLPDMVFVEADDAILVMPRNKSQEVKALYEYLEKNQPQLLE